MAEFRNQSSTTASTTNPPREGPPYATTGMGKTPHAGGAKPDKLSVTAGKLMEVDLGNSLSKHEEEAAAMATKAAKPVKVRLGPDGKPWRPRKRRNSENLARDALIDSMMKENSCGWRFMTTSLNEMLTRHSIEISGRRAIGKHAY